MLRVICIFSDIQENESRETALQVVEHTIDTLTALHNCCMKELSRFFITLTAFAKGTCF